MATFAFTNLTIPTLEPYEKTTPSKQLENLCYVLLQCFVLAKNAGVTVSDTLNITTGDLNITSPVLEEIRDNIGDLKFNGYTFKIGNWKITLSGIHDLDLTEG